MPPMALKPLIDLLTAPWAILPETLAEIQRIYALHLRGETVDIAAVEASLGRPLDNQQRSYELRAGGVAVLPVSGVLAPKANMFTQISGGTSTQMLTKALEEMRANSRVQSAVIAWDSPGGNVLGVPAAADALRRLAAAKPTVSVSEGTMASAAYWIGSAANAVFIEGSTDQLGSLGVYQRLSWDQAEPNTMELVRGKYKRASINGNAPSAEQVAYLEGQMDHLYTVLIDAVAQQRGTTAEQVLAHMADGRVFIGQQAIDAGLADGVSTVDAMAERMATDAQQFARRRKAQFALGGLPATDAQATDAQAGDPPADPSQPDPKDTSMSKLLTPAALALTAIACAAALAEEHPAIAAELRAQGAADGAKAERDRIAAVRAQCMPGHEALIEAMVADGKTTGPEAAMAVLQAEKALAGKHATALRADTPPPLKNDASADGAGDGKKPDPKAKAANPMADARAMADRVVKRQAEASAAGRQLSATEALAQIKAEDATAA